MTVYIDTAWYIPAEGKKAKLGYLSTAKWCHMYADTKEELHEFAELIGLKHSWLQDHAYRWHYDLTGSKIQAAIDNGAVQITSVKMIELMRDNSNGKNA